MAGRGLGRTNWQSTGIAEPGSDSVILQPVYVLSKAVKGCAGSGLWVTCDVSVWVT